MDTEMRGPADGAGSQHPGDSEKAQRGREDDTRDDAARLRRFYATAFKGRRLRVPASAFNSRWMSEAHRVEDGKDPANRTGGAPIPEFYEGIPTFVKGRGGRTTDRWKVVWSDGTETGAKADGHKQLAFIKAWLVEGLPEPPVHSKPGGLAPRQQPPKSQCKRKRGGPPKHPERKPEPPEKALASGPPSACSPEAERPQKGVGGAREASPPPRAHVADTTSGYDFDAERTESHVQAGQVWAVYDDTEEIMPRWHVHVRGVQLEPAFEVQVTWLGRQTVHDCTPAGVGFKYPLDPAEYKSDIPRTIESINSFSHQVNDPVWYGIDDMELDSVPAESGNPLEESSEESSEERCCYIAPRAGEVWAMHPKEKHGCGFRFVVVQQAPAPPAGAGPRVKARGEWMAGEEFAVRALARERGSLYREWRAAPLERVRRWSAFSHLVPARRVPDRAGPPPALPAAGAGTAGRGPAPPAAEGPALPAAAGDEVQVPATPAPRPDARPERGAAAAGAGTAPAAAMGAGEGNAAGAGGESKAQRRQVREAEALLRDGQRWKLGDQSSRTRSGRTPTAETRVAGASVMTWVTGSGAGPGHLAVGTALRVWWPADAEFYAGCVTAYDPFTDTHSVAYEDGDREDLQLSRETFLLQGVLHTPPPPPTQPAERSASTGGNASDKGTDASADADAPDEQHKGLGVAAHAPPAVPGTEDGQSSDVATLCAVGDEPVAGTLAVPDGATRLAAPAAQWAAGSSGGAAGAGAAGVLEKTCEVLWELDPAALGDSQASHPLEDSSEDSDDDGAFADPCRLVREAGSPPPRVPGTEGAPERRRKYVKSEKQRLKEMRKKGIVPPDTVPGSPGVRRAVACNMCGKTGNAVRSFGACSLCGESDYHGVLLQCAAPCCQAQAHLRCVHRGHTPPQTFAFRPQDRWYCCKHKASDSAPVMPAGTSSAGSQRAAEILDVRTSRGKDQRVATSAHADVEYLVRFESAGGPCDAGMHASGADNGSDAPVAWIGAEAIAQACSSDVLQRFLTSGAMRLLVHARQSATGLLYEDRPIPSMPGATHRVYRLASNCSLFGISQYLGLFTDAEVDAMEARVREVQGSGRDGGLMDNTVNTAEHSRRTKYFFGYGYKDYSSGGPEPTLVGGVDPVPQWIHAASHRVRSAVLHSGVPSSAAPAQRGPVSPEHTDTKLGSAGGADGDWVDMAVLNVYHTATGCLGVHVDSRALFERPIFSLRLFAPGVLSFGCRGMGRTDRLHAIPQPRGAVTTMDGYAANVVNHCVRPGDSPSMACSLMLRRLTQRSLLAFRRSAALPALPPSARGAPSGPSTPPGPDQAQGPATPAPARAEPLGPVHRNTTSPGTPFNNGGICKDAGTAAGEEPDEAAVEEDAGPEFYPFDCMGVGSWAVIRAADSRFEAAAFRIQYPKQGNDRSGGNMYLSDWLHLVEVVDKCEDKRLLRWRWWRPLGTSTDSGNIITGEACVRPGFNAVDEDDACLWSLYDENEEMNKDIIIDVGDVLLSWDNDTEEENGTIPADIFVALENRIAVSQSR